VKVFIWGAGRVGRSLGRALEEADGDVTVVGTWNRSFPRALETSQLLRSEASAGDVLPDAFPRADVVLLTVVDDAVSSTADLLARHLSPRQCLIHTSGGLPSTAMASDGMRALLGSCHPLQSLADPAGDPEKLRGSAFAVEGAALQAAQTIALAVGGRPVEISTSGKVAYHAAAVLSANYLTVLVDAACDLLESAGVAPAVGIDMLMPLLRGTLENLEAANRTHEDGREAIAASLTGPVRRGDAATVRSHIKTLGQLQDEDLAALYHLLTTRAIKIVHRVSPEAAARIHEET
jgi:predicted short-subunit dehydrogenase-like oxidoreductase (DUF2520 family)